MINFNHFLYFYLILVLSLEDPETDRIVRFQFYSSLNSFLYFSAS